MGRFTLTWGVNMLSLSCSKVSQMVSIDQEIGCWMPEYAESLLLRWYDTDAILKAQSNVIK